MDVSNLLKPSLQMGELRCIGSCTHEDFRRSLEKDRALIRRFQKIISTLGIENALREAGIEEGDTVYIADFELEWQE